MEVEFGKANTFNSSQQECPLYVERLGYVIEANGNTKVSKKRELFLSVIRDKLHIVQSCSFSKAQRKVLLWQLNQQVYQTLPTITLP